MRLHTPSLTLVLTLLAGCGSPESRDAPPPPEVGAGNGAALALPEPAAATPMGDRVRQEAARSHSLGSGMAKLVQEPWAPAPAPSFSGEQDRERYAALASNPVQRAAEQPVSTFSVDVDTGAYSNLRRFLRQGQMPPSDAVRVEELVNYFDYAYAAPRSRDTPFGLVTELGPTPWNARTHLLHIGIQGWKPEGRRLPANLVFLVDVSGSMERPDKLPLVKSSLRLLTRDLGSEDRISMVVYAGASGVVLEPTPGNQTERIVDALERLQAGGSTNGGAGIEQAYRLARQARIEGGVNRVLLATDGDFNVGLTSFERLLDLVREQRRSGVELTTLGFGQGNYNEPLMEQLADVGNGNYAYIDSLAEAQKVLVRERQASLETIARDVKVQVEFNPAVVAEYRLIGYENRALRREDFSNDAVDAGEIGAGHTVTALYEVALLGEGGERIEPLRYGAAPPARGPGTELAHLRLRYKRPGEGVDATSRLIEKPVALGAMHSQLDATSESYRFSAAVAGFGQLLRGARYTGDFGYPQVLELARSARGADPDGENAEFLQLVQLAEALAGEARVLNLGRR